MFSEGSRVTGCEWVTRPGVSSPPPLRAVISCRIRRSPSLGIIQEVPSVRPLDSAVHLGECSHMPS